MKLYVLDEIGRRPITDFESQHAFVSPIVAGADVLQAVSIQVEPNGVLGSHEAVTDQLFIVISGYGQVASDWSPSASVETGVAVF